MDQSELARRFHRAAARARDFARGFAVEELPDEMTFRLRLNSSYDGNRLHPDERVFPADGSPDLARALSSCPASRAIELLWRDGMVPEWVDLSVIGVRLEGTLVQVLACGRFTANQALLYHAWEGNPPFHVLGPALPLDYGDGDRFSMYASSECWSPAELDHVARHARHVRSLALCGAGLDDGSLAGLRAFEPLESLEISGAAIRGDGLVALDGHARLRGLRIRAPDGGAVSLAPIAHLPALTSLSVSGVAAEPIRLASLAARLPRLERLDLQSEHALVLEARWPRPLEDFVARAPNVSGTPLPETLRALALELSEATDADIARLLAPVRSVENLSLCGTPVTDALVEALAARPELVRLDVTGTRVTDECLRRICARRSALQVRPTPSAGTVLGKERNSD